MIYVGATVEQASKKTVPAMPLPNVSPAIDTGIT